MAYWGIGMALPGKDNEAGKERAAALEIALQLQSKVSPHERSYLSVLQKLIQSGPSLALPELQKIIQTYPNDTNAVAWFSLWSNKGYQDELPSRDTNKAITAINMALRKSPHDIALNHYLIHILEAGPDFEQARQAADSLAKIATGSGHLTHMPGHIYYLAGEYDKACEAFLRCDTIEKKYLDEEKIPAIDHKNYIHNLLYLVQAASDRGDYQLATETATRLSKISAPEDRLKAQASQINLYSSPVAMATPHIRARDFKKAATLLSDDLIPEKSPARHYLKVLKYNCLLKDLLLQPGPLSDKDLGQVHSLADLQSKEIDTLLAAKPRFFGESQPLALAKKSAKILKLESRAMMNQAQLTKDGEFQLTWALSAILMDDRHTEPPIMISPVPETLGWCALSKGHPSQAITFFKQALEKRKRSGHIYQGLAQASQELGKESDFQKYSALAKSALFKAEQD